MDFMKVSSTMMKRAIANIFTKMIKKKIGCDVDVTIDELMITEEKEGEYHFRINVYGDVNKKEILKILAKNGLC